MMEIAELARTIQDETVKPEGARSTQQGAPLIVTDIYDLIAADLKDPEPIIAPILFEADLLMIYGWRGCGKTWFSLSGRIYRSI